VLKKNHQHLSIFNHSLFLSNEFLQFQHSVQQHVDNAQEPEQHALEAANPLVARVLASQGAAMQDAISAMSAQMKQHHQETKQQMEQLRHTPFYPYLGGSPMASPQASTSHAVASTPASAAPSYRLDRSHKTVMQVWQEYEEGMPGCLAVKDLEQRYGTGWRKDPTESKYYSRRKVLYDEFKKIAIRDRISLKEAAKLLEETRKYHGKTLDTLCGMLKENSSQ
jgi:hypothetical protein